MNAIGVVLVTYNRVAKLQKSLECYDKQTYLPTFVIVVDNASTDGTGEYLREWLQTKTQYKKYVITCEENIGGSGGFHEGLKKAEELSNADWIWVADDDAYTEKEAFSNLNNFLNNCTKQEISAVCGKVTEHGELSRAHRKNIYCKRFRIVEDRLNDNNYETPFEINAFSYVGTAISLEKLKKVGLPNKDYFIWYDDAEHAMRLSKVGKIICVPQICVEHDNQVVSQGEKSGIDWRVYYGIRNSYDFYIKYFPRYIVEIQYNFRALKSLAKAIVVRDFSVFNMYKHALSDARKGKMGKSDIYYPGMKGKK